MTSAESDRRHHDGRELGGLAEPAADGEPVDPGQHEVEQVEQDEFDAGVTGALESLLAGVDDVDVEALVVQVGGRA